MSILLSVTRPFNLSDWYRVIKQNKVTQKVRGRTIRWRFVLPAVYRTPNVLFTACQLQRLSASISPSVSTAAAVRSKGRPQRITDARVTDGMCLLINVREVYGSDPVFSLIANADWGKGH